MTKLAGSLLIFVSSVMTGLAYACRLKDRVRLLRAFKALVQSFSAQLSLSRPELSRLFLTDSGSMTSPITGMIGNALSENGTPEECVRAAFDAPYPKYYLTEAERSCLITAFSAIGGGDLASALKTLESASKALDTYINNAAEDERARSKTGFALSVYVGLAAVILLM